jgi:hypothetical protein
MPAPRVEQDGMTLGVNKPGVGGRQLPDGRQLGNREVES